MCPMDLRGLGSFGSYLLFILPINPSKPLAIGDLLASGKFKHTRTRRASKDGSFNELRGLISDVYRMSMYMYMAFLERARVVPFGGRSLSTCGGNTAWTYTLLK